MNKADLIEQVMEKTDLSKSDATAAVAAVFDTITDELKKEGGIVSILGFGNFQARLREARKGRNPKTGESIDIAASKVPAFKAGKGLKDALNV